MQPYQVSARKYRPATFDTVVGQKALTTTLKNAVATGRLAHSYLFCGSRGVGKTSCARIFAKTINCEHRTPEGEACNECDSCKAFNAGTSLNILELDAASNNGVDAIRDLVEQVQVPPAVGKYRVFIVDEVHMLSSGAFNAFLKTLEEPPKHVIFILATTEKHKIIPTILSRCQIYDFHRITIPDMISHLQYVAKSEGITAEEAALNVIARKADGAMRDALSIFDQVAACCGGNITYKATIENLNVLDYEYYNKLLEAFLAGDVLRTWVIYKEIRDAGFDSQFFINGLAAYLRDLMAATDPSTLALVEAGEEAKAAMKAIAAKCTPGFLYRAMNLCNEADLNYRAASGKQFLIELTLAKICQSLSPSPKGSDGEGRLKPIDAANSSVEQTEHTLPAPDATAAPAPAPAVVPPAGGGVGMRGATSLRTPRVSLRTGLLKDQPAAGAVKEKPKRSKLFSYPEFENAWNSFINAHPKERIIVNTMRTSVPVTTDSIHFTAEVTNEMQRDLMVEKMPQILAWLRDRLENDHIELDVNVVESAEGMRYTLNDRELMAKIVEENPFVGEFMEKLKLKLS
ncbi:MAG: DNA polymerase III subunit gamma/tau [Muribaculaceae bacterium]|nr:DNA polymerase III subunit gamma/tau [Muribaculaceae bacterium]